MDGWMGRWVDGWMSAWMDRWVGGWISIDTKEQGRTQWILRKHLWTLANI